MDKNTKKYYNLNDIPKKIKKEVDKMVKNSPFRQKFHIEAPSGYLNDPNGFSFFNGECNLFYQWTPYMYSSENVWYQGWYHLKGTDFLTWEKLGAGIEADEKFATHGAYSGSAIADDDKLTIFYTGNTRNEDWQRIPYQVIATMDKNNIITKRENPEITGTLDGYTDHFRDPKIWKNFDGEYYAIIGIQRKNLTGTAVIAHSKDTYNWQILGEIDTNLKNFGYMWECPDYFELEDNGVFVFSPQGLDPQGNDYHNIYQTGYLIGDKIDKNNLKLNEITDFQELDKGFDFYAPQSTSTPDNRRILIGWMGLPEMKYPTEKYGYCGCLTLPRELTIKNGKLYQNPVKEIDKYRKNKIILNKEELKTGISAENSYELQAKFENIKESFTIDLFSNEKHTEYARIKYSATKKELWLDRGNMDIPVNESHGTKRLIANNLENNLTLDIFVDTSSIEIFVNNGEKIASSRIFTTNEERFIFTDLKENAGKITYVELDF